MPALLGLGRVLPLVCLSWSPLYSIIIVYNFIRMYAMQPTSPPTQYHTYSFSHLFLCGPQRQAGAQSVAPGWASGFPFGLGPRLVLMWDPLGIANHRTSECLPELNQPYALPVSALC